MKDNRQTITIKQVGYTYVFRVMPMLCQGDMERVREDLRQQLREGCVVLPAGITLESVEPRLETFIE